MINQYHFQLVFLRLLLKRNALSDSKVRFTLIQTTQTLDPNAPPAQTEEAGVRKNQKIVDLDSLKTFHFKVNREQKSSSFVIRFEIKGTSEERVRTIPINAQKMIDEYERTKKVVFQQSFGGQYAEVSYKFYLTKDPKDNTQPPQQENDLQGHGNQTKRSNSISRTKRPPNLNISKRTPSPMKSEGNQSLPKQIFGHFPIGNTESQLSPMSGNPNKLPELTLNNAESRFESGVQKKLSSLPLSEIEKVKELIQTHHRPQDDGHHHQISIKLKTVIAMLFIGIAFLLFDTLSDRKIRKIAKGPQDDHNGHSEPHAQHGEEDHHPPKKAKKAKASSSGKASQPAPKKKK